MANLRSMQREDLERLKMVLRLDAFAIGLEWVDVGDGGLLVGVREDICGDFWVLGLRFRLNKVESTDKGDGQLGFRGIEFCKVI